METLTVEALAKTFREKLRELLQGKQTLSESLQLTNEKIQTLAVLAQDLAQQGKTADAEAILLGLTVVAPDDTYLYNCLGTLYLRQQQYNSALSAFHYALSLNQNDIFANSNLGEFYLLKGSLDRALPYLKKAASLDSGKKVASANRARTLLFFIANIHKELQEKGPDAAEQIKKEISNRKYK